MLLAAFIKVTLLLALLDRIFTRYCSCNECMICIKYAAKLVVKLIITICTLAGGAEGLHQW